MRHARTTAPRRGLARFAAAGVAALAVGVATLPATGVAQAAQSSERTVASVQHQAAKKKLKQRKKALAMLARVNAVRASGTTCNGTWYGPVPPLRYSLKLATAARLHAKDMRVRGYFDHYSTDGRSPTDRARAVGFPRGVGENIAVGYRTVGAVMKGWLASEGHCTNLMSRNYSTFGFGFAGSPDQRYWVQDFGLR